LERQSATTEEPENPSSNLANAGIYAVTSGVVGPLLLPDARDMGFDVLPRLIARMHAWKIRGYHRDIGTPRALTAAEADVASGALEAGEEEEA
jgi:mannose-1-phosphate guanylyltransferase